jgi:hypothetical protein
MAFKKDCIYYADLPNPRKPIYEVGDAYPRDFEKIPGCLKNNFIDDKDCPKDCPYYKRKNP